MVLDVAAWVEAVEQAMHIVATTARATKSRDSTGT
jgi:hypothetical protein